MFRKLLSLFMVMSLMLFVVVGCTSQEKDEDPDVVEGTDFPFSIKDSYGQELTFESKPERVISVAPSITETIFALGQQEVLVGRTDFCDYPADVSAIDSVGTLREPNIEKIIELEPDLVVASTHFSEDVYDKLESLGIKVILLNPQNSFEGVYEVISKLGQILDVNEQATNMINEMKDLVNSVEEKIKDQEKPTVYYVVGYGEYGDYTAGGGTFISEMIAMASGINIADDMEGWSYSLEKLVEHDPQIMIVSKYNNVIDGIKEANGYQDLTAIIEGNVFEIDNNLLDRQGPRLAKGFEELAKIIHPDAFK
ncbi:ABC transporter substrate-binding protein [Alkalicella caledoniensis]|uniref:ABC transporter substrate-binding protein n=1 Tax=Alkalicella caledoniensis TaxID=2731377 RepID=A0A7G9W5A2_ALKCA|nr:ABC transporter substrate-binding protein [Alkalicella caledoniensis]QNO13864.1 ABC transporter substrate-binding protein [Alkalicella caledoniensis]